MTFVIAGLHLNLQSGSTRFHRLAIAAAIVAASAALSGCGSSGLFGDQPGSQVDSQLAPSQKPAAQKLARVTIAPVIGAPDAISKRLAQDMSDATVQKNVTVTAPGETPDYTLRGYVVAAKDRAGIKVSYIWDVTTAAGQRVNRITGEEIIAGTATPDAWSAVTPAVSQSIASKSSVALASWLSSQAPAAVASTSGATVGQQAPTAVGALPQNSQPPAMAAQASAAPQNTASAGVGMAPAGVVIPSLTGAPGDGNTALARALQAELSKNGVNQTNDSSAYRVEGVVKVGAATGDKQAIQIDWNVRDSQGKRVGTVTQKNEITPGSLDNDWGKTADAAAAAAAQGILKLLPRNSATN